uniref:Uncharacterized protein n=1 Tax=Anguilla anguilla TaxID=7936 RepID=A0A0E9XP71_ANGAN
MCSKEYIRNIKHWLTAFVLNYGLRTSLYGVRGAKCTQPQSQ